MRIWCCVLLARPARPPASEGLDTGMAVSRLQVADIALQAGARCAPVYCVERVGRATIGSAGKAALACMALATRGCSRSPIDWRDRQGSARARRGCRRTRHRLPLVTEAVDTTTSGGEAWCPTCSRPGRVRAQASSASVHGRLQAAGPGAARRQAPCPRAKASRRQGHAARPMFVRSPWRVVRGGWASTLAIYRPPLPGPATAALGKPIAERRT